MNENIYIYFSEMKLHVLFTPQIFLDFLAKTYLFLRIFEDKVKKNHIK